VLLQPRALYWLKVYEVPEGTRNSRGKPIVNLFPLVEGEKITAVLPVKEFDEEHFVFMATSEGHGQEDRADRSPIRARPASSRSAWTTATT
jgi:DNA gyrase/topoisomerase IV subunit A